MRLLDSAIALFATTTVALSQGTTESMNQSTRDRINLTNMVIPATGTWYGFKGEAGKVIGDPYLDSTWQAGNVRFYGKLSPTVDSLAGVPIRIDLANNDVEIRAGANDIRSAKASTVRYMDVNNRTGTVSRFVNVREYRGDADGLSGFFEKILTGKAELLLHSFIRIKKATYNPALNTGSKDDEIIKKNDWYIAQNKQATKFSPGKKALLELMADKKNQIETFLKTEKPDLKTKSGLMAVVGYYNSL